MIDRLPTFDGIVSATRILSSEFQVQSSEFSHPQGHRACGELNLELGTWNSELGTN